MAAELRSLFIRIVVESRDAVNQLNKVNDVSNAVAKRFSAVDRQAAVAERRFRSVADASRLLGGVTERLRHGYERLKEGLRGLGGRLERLTEAARRHKLALAGVSATMSVWEGLIVKSALSQEKYVMNVRSLVSSTEELNQILEAMRRRPDVISEEQFLQAAAAFKEVGLQASQFLDFINVAGLFAATTGRDMERVIYAVYSAATGYTTSLKRMGIFITQKDITKYIKEHSAALEGMTEDQKRMYAVIQLVYPELVRRIGDLGEASKSAYYRWVRFKTAWSDFTSTIGYVLLPALTRVTDALTGLMRCVERSRLKYLVAWVPVAVTAFAGLVTAIWAVTKAVDILKGALVALKGIKLATWVASLGLGPLLPIILGLTAAVLVLQHAWVHNLFGVRDAALRILSGLKKAFGAVFTVIKAVASGIAAALRFVFAPVLRLLGLTDEFGRRSRLLAAAVSAVGGFFRRLHAAVEPHLPLIKKILKVVGALAVVFLLVSNPIGWVVLAVSLLSRAFLLLKEHAGKIAGAFKKLAGVFVAVRERIAGFASKLSVLKYALLPLAAPALAVYFAIKHWDELKGVVAGVAAAVKSKLAGAFAAVKGAAEGVGAALRRHLRGVVTALHRRLGSAADALRRRFEESAKRSRTVELLLEANVAVRERRLKAALASLARLPAAYAADAASAMRFLAERIGEAFGVPDLVPGLRRRLTAVLDALRAFASRIPAIIKEAFARLPALIVASIKKAFAALGRLGKLLARVFRISMPVKAEVATEVAALEAAKAATPIVKPPIVKPKVVTPVVEPEVVAPSVAPRILKPEFDRRYYEEGSIRLKLAAPPITPEVRTPRLPRLEAPARVRWLVDRPRLPTLPDLAARIGFVVGKLPALPKIEDLRVRIGFVLRRLRLPRLGDLVARVRFVLGRLPRPKVGDIIARVRFVLGRLRLPEPGDLVARVRFVPSELPRLGVRDVVVRVRFLLGRLRLPEIRPPLVVPRILKPEFDRRYYEEGSIVPRVEPPAVGVEVLPPDVSAVAAAFEKLRRVATTLAVGVPAITTAAAAKPSVVALGVELPTRAVLPEIPVAPELTAPELGTPPVRAPPPGVISPTLNFSANVEVHVERLDARSEEDVRSLAEQIWVAIRDRQTKYVIDELRRLLRSV